MSATARITPEQKILAVLRADGHMITNALYVFARRMDEAAQEASTAHEAGLASMETKAVQDASFITNNGLRASANLFSEQAADARRIAAEVEAYTNPQDEDGN